MPGCTSAPGHKCQFLNDHNIRSVHPAKTEQAALRCAWSGLCNDIFFFSFA